MRGDGAGGKNSPPPTEWDCNSRPALAAGGLQLGLIENRGQFDQPVRFAARSQGLISYVTPHGLVHTLVAADPAVVRFMVDRKQRGPHAGKTPPGGSMTQPARPQWTQVAMHFEAADPAVVVEGTEQRAAHVSYFVGSDQSRWAAGVPTFDTVRYRDLYPGIDVMVQQQAGALERIVVAAPGADASVVTLRIDGAEQLELVADGALLMHTPLGRLRQSAPLALLRRADGESQPVQCEYRIVDATHVRFVLPAIDPTATLVIDPVVGVLYEPQYFTYLGGSGHDVAMDIAVTTHGRATIVGTTVSQNFPVTTMGRCW